MKILPPAIFLMGPTASGKTGVAVELMQQMPVEIISVDSALVFRDMDIGTAKPDAATLARAPHHLIDIIDPTEAYSAAAFRTDALRLMEDITSRGKIPLLVGGTMLYFKALREGLSDLPPSQPEVRAALDAEIAEHGIEHLHQQLAAVDAETAARLQSTDTQRIQRAMEIYRITGQPMSALLKKPSSSPASLPTFGHPLPPRGEGLGVRGERLAVRGERLAERGEIIGESDRYSLPYSIIPIALIPSQRAKLHERIAIRFQTMLQQGLLDELTMLRNKYQLNVNMTSMRCVGYRQAWQFMEGEIDETQLLETGLAATRQLAKRQLTWLRSMPDSIEIDCLSTDLVQQVGNILNDKLS